MANNLTELAEIYKQISVLEMVEKLKNGGLVWNKVSPYQYATTVVQGSDYWDMYITRLPNGEAVVLDFRKNANYFYSINSTFETYLTVLFNELEGDEDLTRDRDILAAVQQYDVCGPNDYNEFMHKGVVVAGAAVVLKSFAASGGILANGGNDNTGIFGAAVSGGILGDGFATRFVRRDITTSGGLMASGTAPNSVT
jgi:hypothetical protein